MPTLLATARTTTLALPPEARLVVPLTVLPLTLAVAPVLLTMETAVKLTGTTSLKVAFVTGLGPALLIVSVNVTVWPTATLGLTLTLVRERSALGVTASVS